MLGLVKSLVDVFFVTVTEQCYKQIIKDFLRHQVRKIDINDY